jgi:triacylglycerol lipase
MFICSGDASSTGRPVEISGSPITLEIIQPGDPEIVRAAFRNTVSWSCMPRSSCLTSPGGLAWPDYVLIRMKIKLLILMALFSALLPCHARGFRQTSAVSNAQTQFPPQAPQKGRIVLVHGFLETGGNFDMMRKRLQSQGYECLVPRLRPSDGQDGLDVVADRLKCDIETAFGEKEPLTIIAFSMGGLVSRYYLQQLGGAERCNMFITISSPHHGTQAAWLYPTSGAQQMRPGSEFLTRLAESESKLGKMPVISYRTPMDLIILPSESSIWDRAENLEFPVLLHPLMLSSRPVLRDIERRLADLGAD